MTSTFVLQRGMAQALALHACDDINNPCYNQIALFADHDRWPDKIILAAWNRHRLFMCATELNDLSDDGYAPITAMFSADALKGFLASNPVQCTIPADWETLDLRQNSRSNVTPLDPANGRVPDLWRVIPKECSGMAAQFAMRYLADIGKTHKLLRFKSEPVIHHNGDSPAVIDHHRDDVINLLMPCRFDGGYPPLPAWAQQDS